MQSSMKTLSKSLLFTLPTSHHARLDCLCIREGNLIMEEIWKDIEGYEGYYKASNLGRVMRLRKSVDDIIMLPHKHRGGYLQIRLSVNGKVKSFYIHRIVAKLFIENPSAKRTVNHIDCNKKNNKVDNLEWATHSENHNHAFKNNLKIGSGRKLSDDDVFEMRYRHFTLGQSINSLSIKHGICSATGFVAIKGQTFKNMTISEERKQEIIQRINKA